MSVLNILLSEARVAAAPTFHAQGTVVANGGTTSNTGALPTRSTNDILIMELFVSIASLTFSINSGVPAGWVQGDTVTNTTGTMAWFWRIVDGAEAAPLISWGGATANSTSFIYSFSGAKSSPIGATEHTNGTTNPMTAAALTTTAKNSLIFFMGGVQAAQTSIPTPASYTIAGVVSLGAVSPAIIAADQSVAASGGASTAVSISASVAGNWMTMELELKAN